MFKQFFEVFWPMAVEYVAEQGLNSAKNIKDSEQVLETLQKNFVLLSAKASDIEGEIKNAELSGRKKRKRQVKEWLEQVESIELEVDELGSQAESQGFVMRFLDGGKAAQLNEQVEKLLQQSLNFRELVLDVRGTMGETLLANGMVGEAFNEYFETILELLENRQVSKIGVYGMGGVGKTTLAKHIYNRLLQRSQGPVIWITVSQEFTVMSLQDKIARSLGLALSDEEEEAIRAGRLNRFLCQTKNSALILDDVWEKIDMLKVGCTFSAEFCRLIITTRCSKVCYQLDCQEIIQVEKLRKDEAWLLFSETLGRERKISPQVEEIAKSMAKLCDGLPLGIVTVAGSMKGETAIHTWRHALAELKESVAGGKNDIGEVDEVFRVLKYSFDQLKRNDERELNRIQRSLMYCSLYPEDYKIVRDDLVREFISDGLVDERKSRRAQVEQGHYILDKLVNVCLLESCVDFNDKECVKMHDLVRGMTLKLGKGRYMVRGWNGALIESYAPDDEEWTEGLEKVSLIRSGIRRFEDGFSPNCPNLSTLLLCKNLAMKYIPDSFFSKMQGLCTLDLRGSYRIAILPESISELKTLKALLLEGCQSLVRVPYLGKMKALRELNLSTTGIMEAPQGLEKLLNLRFLSMNAHGLQMLPRGLLPKLVHLQHVNLPSHLNALIEEFENLKLVEEVCGGVKDVKDFNRLIRTRVHGTCCYKLGVRLGYDSLRFIKYERFEGQHNKLVLCESNLNDEKVLGKGVVDLTIWRCEGLSKCFADDLWERFDNPKSLMKLDIRGCGGIEWIMRRSDSQGLSSTLEEIEVWGLNDLKGVMMERGDTGAPAVFSSLKKLEIINCNKMRKVGLAASGVPNLEWIHIWECGEVEGIFEDEGRDRVTTLPKLKWLSLCKLPRLKRVSKAAIISNSINYINISKCPGLMTKLPLHFDDTTPPTSQFITVEREWWESLEWDINSNLPLLLQSFVHYID